jgi:hypothetical protein
MKLTNLDKLCGILEGHLPRIEEMHQSFFFHNTWKQNITWKDFIEKGFEDVNLICLIQDRDQWWGLLNIIWTL